MVNFPHFFFFKFEMLLPVFKNPFHNVTLLSSNSRLSNVLVGHSDTRIGRTSSIGDADLAVMWAGDLKREVVHHERHGGI